MEKRFLTKGVVAPTNFLSCDGDYASVRVGKAQMLASHRAFLRTKLGTLPNRASVLDVAAARGDFAEFLLAEFPHFDVQLEEHSEQMLDNLVAKMSQRKNVMVRIAAGRSGYPSDRFDFIYATHSLEHFRNPRQVMERWRKALRPSGTLFVDVPDVTKIDFSAVVDDHFYDEHLSYFSEAHLEELGSLVGLRIADSRQCGGSIVVAMVREENLSTKKTVLPLSKGLFETEILKSYPQNLERNRRVLPSKVKSLARRISQHNGSVIAIGCGRKFDAYRIYGEMHLEHFDFFFDTYLSRSLTDFHGNHLFSLDEIEDVQMDNPIFVIFGSSSSEGMARVLMKSGFHRDQVIAA